MPISVLDSRLFRDMFGTAAMRDIFSEDAYLARCTDAEIALARAQGRLGVIPAAAADRDRRRRAVRQALDMAALAKETEIVGYPILPLIHQLAPMCGEGGGYLHWGATTQDIMDLATVLQMRAGIGRWSRAELDAVRQALVVLARHPPRHRDGRAQPPATGAAHHLRLQGRGLAVRRWTATAVRLAELRPRVLMAQFGGAAGTLASLGQGGRGPARAGKELARGAGPGGAADHLACGARRAGGGGAVPGADGRHAWARSRST